MRIIFIIGSLIAGVLFSSCGGNRMKSDEKALFKQILTEEEQLTHQAELRAEREKQLADSLAKRPKGFRFQEDRSVDSNNLPVAIDIIGNRGNKQDIKLSQLFSKIEYVKLANDPDSLTSKYKGAIIVGENHIYTISRMFGIIQYDLKGKFKQYVCKNKIYQCEDKLFNQQAISFEGASSAYLAGGRLYYKYEDQTNKKAFLMVFNDKNEEPGFDELDVNDNIEEKNKIRGKGEKVLNLVAGFEAQFNPEPYFIGEKLIAYAPRKKILERQLNFVSVVSTNGDTICEMPDYDPVTNFTKSTYRGVDSGDNYYHNGLLHLRQSFNDTIYQLVPPNRLIPKYVLDFGDKGIGSVQEGVDPGYNLEEKLIVQSFFETKRFLFITYSKNYPCPNTARNGTLKFSRIIFDKKNKTVITLYIDEAPFFDNSKMSWPSPVQPQIENDLDGLPFRWPNNVTSKGEPFSIFSGNELLEIKNSPINRLKPNDQIIAIYR